MRSKPYPGLADAVGEAVQIALERIEIDD